MAIILASQSPRRQELMGLYHLPFTVRVADIDETMDESLPPFQEVARVSWEKAFAVSREPEDTVIAADTIVVCGNRILGKPKTPDQARETLALLSGRSHQVMTGLTVLFREQAHTVTEVTEVFFRSLSPEEIRAYVATGEPMDKAGSYGIQGGGALFCEKIQGDYYNVMGLPVCRLGQILAQLGILTPEVSGEEPI